MRRLHVGEENPRHPRVTLAKNLIASFHGHIADQGHGESLDHLREVLAVALLGRCDTINRAAVATMFSRQATGDNTLLVAGVEMPASRRFDMVTPSHRSAGPRPRLRRQRAPSSTRSTNVEEIASSCAATRRQAFPSPSKCPKIYSGAIGRHHPAAIRPPRFHSKLRRTRKTSHTRWIYQVKTSPSGR